MADLADEIDDYQEEEEPLFADDLEDFPEDEPPPLPPPLDFSGPSPTTDGLRVGLGPTSGSPEQGPQHRPFKNSYLLCCTTYYSSEDKAQYKRRRW